MENSYALIVGIANYQMIRPLPPTVRKDALDIYNLLIDPSFCGYPVGNVQLLLDEHATQSALQNALTELSKITNSDSTVFIYYSGHGGRLEQNAYAGEYLLPIDTRPNSMQSIAESAISGQQFTEALKAIPARKVVVIFDCCHSGGIGEPKDLNSPIMKSGLSDDYYERLSQGRGRVILSASRDIEQSYVLSKDENSIFTKHFLAALKGGITSTDGLIRIFDLFEYIQPKVTIDKPEQHPVFKANLEENFPISLYLGGQKGVTIPTPEKTSEFLYDVYISYVDEEPDASWVWDVLIPRLEAEGIKVAVSEDVAIPGVARVINIERGLRLSKRTLVVLSNLYLAKAQAEFENTIIQDMGIHEEKARLIAIEKDDIDPEKFPYRLKSFSRIQLNRRRKPEQQWEHLIKNLKQPIPQRTPDGLYS